MQKIICFFRKLFGNPCVSKPSIYIPNENVVLANDELEFFNLINEHRSSLGINKLKLEQLLCDLAKGHVEYMMDKKLVSHDFFTYRANTSKAKNMGEICAYNYISPKSMLLAYIASPTHYRIIVDPKFTHVGISTINRFNCSDFAAY